MSTPTAAPIPPANFNDAPWSEFPAFTKERLELVGDALREARRNAVLRYQPEEGENRWSLGCNAYVRQMKAIRDLSALNDWLGVLKEVSALAFSFSIGPHAVRFYRGDAEDAPSNYLRLSHGELQHVQYPLQFGDNIVNEELMFRVAVNTDLDGNASDIYFVKMNDEGVILGSYLIPRMEATNVIPLQPKPVDLPPATAVPLHDATAANEMQQDSDDISDEKKNVG